MKRVSSILIAFFLFFFVFSQAQSNFNLSDAASMAMGGNTTTASAQQSILNNPALFAKENYKTIATIGVQNRFQLNELNLLSAGAIFKKKDHAFGMQLQYIGVPDYRNIGVGVSYGRRIFSKLDIGTRLHYAQLDLGNYGKKGILDADLGFHATLNKQISFGFWAKNLLHSKLSSIENTETGLHIGFAYTPSDKVKFCAEAEKFISQAPRFKAGMEYFLAKKFALRGGFQSSPSMPSFGIGYKQNALRLDMSAAFHQNLGVISALNLAFVI
jgi:hypothetical protein